MKQATKKKVSKAKQILEWILIFLSILFLLTLIYFQLPWKLVLALVFLFCSDFLISKRHRKWANIFWGFVLLTIIIWILLPDQEEGWRPYIRYDEIVKHEQQRLIPDKENAALIYKKLFQSLNLDEFRDSIWDVNDILLSTFWVRSDYPDAAHFLNDHSVIVDQVFEALKRDRCYFPLLRNDFQKPNNYKEVADFWYRPLEEISLKYIGDFLLISANSDVSDGNVPLALNKYFAVLQIANHLGQQSEITDIMLRMSLEMRTYKCLQNLLIIEKLDSEDSMKIEERLKTVSHNWKSEIQKVFEREKLRNKSFVYAMLYQINGSGDIRYNRDPNSTLPSQIFIDPDPYDTPQSWLDEHPRKKDYLATKAVKASLLFTGFFVPSDVNETEKMFDKNLAFYDEMLSPDYDWEKKEPLFSWKTTKINLSFFSKMMFEGIMAGYYEKVYDVFLKTEAVKQATQVFITLNRYKNKTGHWPQSLDSISDQVPDGSLIDPMNSGAFVYRVDGDSFVFYSRGKNNEDEYDQLVRWHTDDPNEIDRSLMRRPDDIAIWPHVDN
jgi:hypothetical protein